MSKSNDDWSGCIGAMCFAILVPFLFIGCYAGSSVTTSDGFRDGTIRKVSETGVFFKTWEVEALGDGMRVTQTDSGPVASPETFRYSASDPAVVAKLRELPIGKRARITYRKSLTAWQPKGETQYFITDISLNQ